jgi:hypothetical protein
MKSRWTGLTFSCTQYSVLSTRYSVLLAIVALAVSGTRAEEPFFLGHRAIDDLPTLSPEEANTPQQQALLQALGGDPYGHRASDYHLSGCPITVRPRAIPSNTRHYGGYWVGGSLPIFGDDPTLEEGTFGWDYFGVLFTKRVDLRFSHGRRYQGGSGQYKTDGPRLHR